MTKTTVKNKSFPIKSYVLLHSILLLYSFCSVFSKMASQQPFLSFPFVAYYVLMLAALWQQVLKLLPLTTAFANKAVVMVWGMLWGYFFLGEKITLAMILGAVIVFAGVVLVVSDDK